MRIISNFHDYYDVVMKTGMDRNVVYIRNEKTVELNKKYQLDWLHSHIGSHTTVHMHFLGYCGQIFKVFQVEYHQAFGVARHFFYSYEEFKNFMISNKFGNERDFFKRRWWPSAYYRMQEYDTKPLLELFHLHQHPLFLITSRRYTGQSPRLILSPTLRRLQFYKVKDTYTTYQDIFQFTSGVLNTRENDMVKISDKDKIHKHGFDKWSFRKMPSKK